MIPQSSFFQFQFLLHLFMDILVDLNKLNKVFQANHVDIIHIDENLNIYINMLYQTFIIVEGMAFDRSSKFMRPFLEAFDAS